MARYIALLRGINISGKNKISMPELKTALGEKGFADVKSGFFYSTTATASISTSAPFGKAETSKQLRAGFETKYFS